MAADSHTYSDSDEYRRLVEQAKRVRELPTFQKRLENLGIVQDGAIQRLHPAEVVGSAKDDDLPHLHAFGSSFERLGDAMMSGDSILRDLSHDPALENPYAEEAMRRCFGGDLSESIEFSVRELTAMYPREEVNTKTRQRWATWLLERAKAHLRDGEHSDANKLLSDVVSLDPHTSEAYLYRAQSRIALRHVADAVDDLLFFLRNYNQDRDHTHIDDLCQAWTDISKHLPPSYPALEEWEAWKHSHISDPPPLGRKRPRKDS